MIFLGHSVHALMLCNFVGRCIKSATVNIFRSRSPRLQFARSENLTAGEEGAGRKRAPEVIFANNTRSRESCDALRENDSVLHKKRSARGVASFCVALRRVGRVMRINKTRNKREDEGGRREGGVELCARDRARALLSAGD